MNEPEIKKELAKFFIDVAKLIFGGVVVASIIKIEDVSRIWVLATGLLGTLGFALIGFLILKKK